MRARFSTDSLPRTIADLDEPEVAIETALRLAGARVVYADLPLLRHDFPQLETSSLVARDRALADFDPADLEAQVRRLVDRWLIAHAAVMSRRQVEQTEVNTPITTTGETVTVYRPPRYGRAVVTSVRENVRTAGGAEPGPPWADEPDGLLEVKGAGVEPDAEPSFDTHSDGLMLLGEALTDLAFERLIDAAFRHVGSRFRALPTYAILDAGFDNLLGDGTRGPAGLQVRRANRRPLGGAELPERGSHEELVKFEIEMLLRQFGITSANSGTVIALEEDEGEPVVTYGGIRETEFWTPEEQLEAFRARVAADGPQRFEVINVQITREVGVNPSRAQLVDFGHFALRERFELPVVSAVYDRVLRWGGTLAPDSPHFAQPDPALTLPEDHWGELSLEERTAAAPGLPNAALESRLHLLAYDLAPRLRAGEADAEEVAARIGAPVEAAIMKWRRNG